MNETKQETRYELPVYRTAEAILTATIEDIEAERWTCHVLNENCHVDVRPMGCALGLIGINGGNSQFYVKDNMVRFQLDEPAEAETNGSPWNEPSLMAVRLLYEALPDGRDQDPSQEHMDEAIVDYNDHGNKSTNIEDGSLRPEQALAWFKRAHALAVERGL